MNKRQKKNKKKNKFNQQKEKLALKTKGSGFLIIM